jgi:membrane protein
MPVAAPPPINGEPNDPPQREVPDYAEKLDKYPVTGVGYRAMKRYTHANVGLLAAGSAYYLFLSLLSLLAFAYGIITLFGADQIAQWLTDTLEEALPGLIGDEGIDPSQLRATGAAAGIVGLVLMLYSSVKSVNGASKSMHLIYGAPPDPRKFVIGKLRAAGILLMVAPLVLLSFASASLASGILDGLLEAIGVEGQLARISLTAAGLALGFLLDTLIIWLLLGLLGGIKPNPRPRLIASLLGALAAGIIKQLLSAIIAWSLDKPEYGALAIPLALLFVFSLLSTVLYSSAAVVAGISDREKPLEELVPETLEDDGSEEEAEPLAAE